MHFLKNTYARQIITTQAERRRKREVCFNGGKFNLSTVAIMQIPPRDNGIISKSAMFIKLSKLSCMDVLAYTQSRLVSKPTYA